MNYCCSKKAINITYLCVRARGRVPGRVGVSMRVVLLIQHATHMRHIMTSFVAPLTPLYFSTSHKRHDFRKKKNY